ncbi:MAG TPA: hypothetical protein VEJ87_04315, partial [Acidimicrobiales bacterium]|nr:hypothetical protein [Acidimicrobiales bacterium]
MTVTPGALPESEAATVPPSPTPPVSDESVWRDRALGFIERYALVIVFGLTFLFFCVWPKTSSAFLSLASIRNVLADEGVSGILAIAIIVPLSCGEFDFSVGNNAGLTQVLCAWFIATQAWSPVIGVLVAIAVAAFVGLSNGNTVARIGVNSLIVTLGVSGILLGIDEKVTGGQSITVTSPGLIKLGTGYW